MSRLFDIRQSFQESLETYRREAVVQQRIAKTLACHIAQHVPPPTRLLEIGCGTGFLTENLWDWSRSSTYFLNDLNEEAGYLFDRRYRFIGGDAETIDLPGDLGAIVSASTFQWFRNLSAFFAKAQRLLRSNGVLAFSTFGPTHFQELRKLTENGLTYFSRENLAACLEKKNFQILFSHEEKITLYFDQAVDVLRHLRKTGVNGGFRSPWSVKHFREFQARYEKLFSSGKGLPLTFHPVFLIAKK